MATRSIHSGVMHIANLSARSSNSQLRTPARFELRGVTAVNHRAVYQARWEPARCRPRLTTFDRPEHLWCNAAKDPPVTAASRSA